MKHTLTRRSLLAAAAATTVAATPVHRPHPIGLQSMTTGAQPITPQERAGRIAKVQG